MILFMILPVFLWVGYFAFKYPECSQDFSRRPTLKEVWSHTIVDKTDHRNARAIKIGAVFFSILAILAMLVSSSSGNLSEKDLRATVKGLLALVLTVNILGRHVLHKEQHLESEVYLFPVLGILNVFRATGVFVKGRDFISNVVNLSNITFIGIVIYWLFIL